MGGVFNTVNFNLYHYVGNNPIRYTDPDGRKTTGAVLRPNSNVKTTWLSYNDMVKLWDINNKKFNYSNSLKGKFGIGQALFDNSLMVEESLNLLKGIAKDIFNVAGKASTILGIVLALMPDPKGEIKQKWDNFLASYVDSHYYEYLCRQTLYNDKFFR